MSLIGRAMDQCIFPLPAVMIVEADAEVDLPSAKAPG